MNEIRRNAPCPCGSGRKYKKCCLGKPQPKNGTGFISRKLPRVYWVLAAILLLSIFLRFYGFNSPHGLTFDEGLYAELLAEQVKVNPLDYSAQQAYRIQTATGQPLPDYLGLPIFKHPPLYVYLIALNYQIFGSSHQAAVSVSIFMGCLMILVIFFLGKELYDWRVGLLASFFLAIGPVHWVCSERIWMGATLSFFMLSAVYFFALGRRKGGYLILSGICMGLAMLTKYPGILSLAIAGAYAALVERDLFREKKYWMMILLAGLIFSPWVIWNWVVYKNFQDPLVSAHSLEYHLSWAGAILTEHRSGLFVGTGLAGLIYIMRARFYGLLNRFFPTSTGTTQNVNRKTAGLLVFMVLVFGVPFFRELVLEAFIWKKSILTGWSNPFADAPWHFYLTRLVELSPLYLFSYCSLSFIFGGNKGDFLLLLAAFLILGAFMLIGNYQSRYILPAVPFLMLLSARWQVWVYEKLTVVPAGGVGPGSRNIGVYRYGIKILFMTIVFYFIVKTLRAGWMLAIGPDFGYF